MLGIFDWPILWDDLGRLAIATILGGVLGLERELNGHWAGLRTHMMVSLGAAVFTIGALTIAGDHPDPISRVVQGIAAGIGFLGAGTILKLGDAKEIKGLTTASSIWLAAALGTAAGLAEYDLAAAALLMSLFILAALRPIERYFLLAFGEGDPAKSDRRASHNDRSSENHSGGSPE